MAARAIGNGPHIFCNRLSTSVLCKYQVDDDVPQPVLSDGDRDWPLCRGHLMVPLTRISLPTFAGIIL